MERTCSKCKQPFPLTDEFFQPRQQRGIPGFYTVCRKCNSARKKEWESVNKESRRVKRTAWLHKNPDSKKEWRRKHPGSNSESVRQWRIKNLQHFRFVDNARRAVKWEMKKGRIVRPSQCSRCQITCFPQAHHYLGYEKEHWLDIVFLCRKCHYMEHKKD